MAKAGYSVVDSADPTVAGITIAAATTVHAIGVLAGSEFGLQLVNFTYGFEGVTATDAPVLCQVCRCTFATNPPGTNSTSITADIKQVYGRVIPVTGITAAKAWTAAPTVIEVIDQIPLTPNGGTLKWAEVLGYEPDCDAADGFLLRLRAAQAQVLRAKLGVERI